MTTDVSLVPAIYELDLRNAAAEAAIKAMLLFDPLEQRTQRFKEVEPARDTRQGHVHELTHVGIVGDTTTSALSTIARRSPAHRCSRTVARTRRQVRMSTHGYGAC